MRRSLVLFVVLAGAASGIVEPLGAQGVLPPSPSGAASPSAPVLPPDSSPHAAPTLLPAPAPPTAPSASGTAPLSIDQAARPRVPATPGQTASDTVAAVPLDGYVMAGLIRALVARDLNAVPDDRLGRQYIVSLIKAMNETCGERASNVALRAVEYIDPRAGRAMRGDPQAGFEMLADVLKGLAGGVPGVLAQAEQNAVLLKEGVDDGRLFIGRHTCFSIEFRKLEAAVEAIVLQRAGRPMAKEDPLQWAVLMSPDFRRLRGVPDPTEAMRRRELDQMSAAALKACVSAFDDGEPFCRCAVDTLKAHDLASADWRALGASFHRVAEIKIDHGRLRRDLQTCYR
jgi:hypothetical protein